MLSEEDVEKKIKGEELQSDEEIPPAPPSPPPAPPSPPSAPSAPLLELGAPVLGAFARSKEDPRLRAILDSAHDDIAKLLGEYEKQLKMELSGEACKIRLMSLDKSMYDKEIRFVKPAIAAGREIAIIKDVQKEQERFKILCKHREKIEIVEFECGEELEKALAASNLLPAGKSEFLNENNESSESIHKLVYEAVVLQGGYAQGKLVEYAFCQREWNKAVKNNKDNDEALQIAEGSIKTFQEQIESLRSRKKKPLDSTKQGRDSAPRKKKSSESTRKERDEARKFWRGKIHLFTLKKQELLKLKQPLAQRIAEQEEKLLAVKAQKEKLESYERALMLEINKAKKNKPVKNVSEKNPRANALLRAIRGQNDAADNPQERQALSKPIAPYEQELRELAGIFTTIQDTDIQETPYSDIDIMKLQQAIFDEKDFQGDLKANLRVKLRYAILNRKSVKGLDDAPRKNMEKILGRNFIESYKEKKKKEEEEKKRKAEEPQVKKAKKSKKKLEREAATTPVDENIGDTCQNLEETRKRSVEETDPLLPINENTENRSEGVNARKRSRPQGIEKQEINPTLSPLNEDTKNESQEVKLKKRLRPQAQGTKKQKTESELEEHKLFKAQKEAFLQAEQLLQQEKEARLRAEQEAARLAVEEKARRAEQLLQQEKEARLRAEQEAARLAMEEKMRQMEQLLQQEKEAKLQAEQQAQREREERNRAQAELLRSQTEAAAPMPRSALIVAQRALTPNSKVTQWTQRRTR